MNTFLRNGLATFSVFLLTQTAFAGDDNFLTGILRGQVSSDLTANTAGLAAVEVGPRNYRVSSTVGIALNSCNRFKLTGEWLFQNIDYTFLTGTTREWVQQSAVGLGYQLILNNPIIPYVDFKGYYSYAPSKSLAGVDFLDVASNIIPTDLRRIAGSTAEGVAPTVHFNLWYGAEGTLALNWDDVVYNNKYTTQITAKGGGGTVGFTQVMQLFRQNFKAGLSASVRTPFNYYHAELDWIPFLPTSQLLVGVFGDYTKGKQTLTNTSLVGVNLSYAIDACSSPSYPMMPVPQNRSLLNWIADPAVYMPQVLAIKEEGFDRCPPGSELHFDGRIVNVMLKDMPLDFSRRFPGNGPITFSLTKSSGDAAISSTGLVTASVPSTNVVVTAVGSCGPPVMTNSFDINPNTV